MFQLVISQRLETRVPQKPFELTEVRGNHRHMAFFDFGDWQLIGSSPEVMVQAEPAPRAFTPASAHCRHPSSRTFRPEDRELERICWRTPRNGPST